MIEFLLFLFYVTIIFCLPDEWWTIFGVCVALLLYCIMRRVKTKTILYEIARIVPFVLITFLFNVWLDNLYAAIFVTLKLIIVCWATMAYAQTLSALTFAKMVEKLLSPMNRLGPKINEVGLVVCLALSMIPILRREISEIKCAVRAKGMKLNLHNSYHIVLRLFGRLFKRIDALDMALRSKGVF